MIVGPDHPEHPVQETIRKNRGWVQNEDGTWGPPHVTDEGVELEPEAEEDRSYDLASSDVVLGLSLEDAQAISEHLALFAGIDDGENTDYDELMRLSGIFAEAVIRDGKRVLAEREKLVAERRES